ncbi:MAG: hypothetical protein AAB368_08460 [bacterium]
MAFLIVMVAGCKGKEAPKPVFKPQVQAVAGPPGLLVYASQGRVYRLRKGEAPEQLAAGPAWFPVLNADGSLLAYWEDRGETMRLVVMNIVSRATTTIGEWSSLGALGRSLNLRNAPCWDSKRDRVYFADGRQIWEADADGGNLATVYEHARGGCYSVTVSPESDRFAFVSVTEKDQNLWTYSTRSKKALALTDYTLQDGATGAPAWGPVGGKLAYVLYKAEESNLWMIPADGGQAVVLTKEGRTNAPAWESTGKLLAVSSGAQNAYAWQIALVKAEDGRFLQQLTNAPAGACSPSLNGAW